LLVFVFGRRTLNLAKKEEKKSNFLKELISQKIYSPLAFRGGNMFGLGWVE
jgi:hypothetical protein